MNERFLEPILNEPIPRLSLSVEFCLVAEFFGFNTLADLLERHMNDLLALPGFSHRLWNEYVAFLEERHVGHYLN